MEMVKKLFEADRPDQTTPAADTLPDDDDDDDDDDDEKRHTTSSAATCKPLSFFSRKNLTGVRERVFYFCGCVFFQSMFYTGVICCCFLLNII